MFGWSDLLETILQVLQGWEKVLDESPITIAIFFEKDYRDGNWKLINCLSLEGEESSMDSQISLVRQ